MAKNDICSFLAEALATRNYEQKHEHVLVTLTFAQSLDAKIAGNGGRQLILSCEESMIMTHRLRSKHDAILVGIGTALNDDPQLNIRLLPPDGDGQEIPLPIILDSSLRFSLDSKLMRNYKEGKGRQPTIFTTNGNSTSEWNERRRHIEAAGAAVISIPKEDGELSIPALLEQLKRLGIRSLMVEGGASVISSFLHSSLVDRLIVTVSPTIVGEAGVGYAIGNGQAPTLEHMRSIVVGRDTVMSWRVTRG